MKTHGLLWSAAMLSLMTAHLLLSTPRLSAAETYRVSPVGSSVQFTINQFLINTVSGSFNEYEGTIRYDPDEIENSSLTGVIQAASIDTGNETRDDHLRSEDYFDVSNHPEIRFQSKRVERDANGNVLIGDLTMHEVVREIAIPFEIDPDTGNGRLGFRAELQLNRQDYGVGYGGFLDGTVSDIVTIELAGEAVQH